jgi:GNAT superfamily N-acetyltransferase
MFELPDLSFEVIPFAQWRSAIAPLWNMEGAVERIPATVNGHGQLRYVGRELFERVLFFPIAARHVGRQVGWTSIYNISDEALRVRGIYVLPELRSYGIGRRLVSFAESLWPRSFASTLIYARASNIERYRRWGFAPAGGHDMRAFELENTFPEHGIQLMTRARTFADDTLTALRAGQQQPASHLTSP